MIGWMNKLLHQIHSSIWSDKQYIGPSVAAVIRLGVLQHLIEQAGLAVLF